MWDMARKEVENGDVPGPETPRVWACQARSVKTGTHQEEWKYYVSTMWLPTCGGGCVCHIDGEWIKPPGNPLVSRWAVRHEKEMPLGHITEHKHFAEI